MKRHFQKYRDDRFALTTLQNPNLELRTYADLVQAAQQEREWQPTAIRMAATQPLSTPAAPDSIPVLELPAELPQELPENVASTAPDPTPAAPAPLDSAIPESANLDSAYPDPSNEDTQQLLDSLVADVVSAGASLPPSPPPADDELTPPPTPKPRRKPRIKGPEPTPPERHARKCAICRHP